LYIVSAEAKGCDEVKIDQIAVIDIGSNTIRLVLYKYDVKRGMKEIENIKVVARLRNFILPDGRLSDQGIAELQTILETFKEMLHDYGIEDVLATATAAIRQATNGVEILEKMKKRSALISGCCPKNKKHFMAILRLCIHYQHLQQLRSIWAEEVLRLHILKTKNWCIHTVFLLAQFR
jgi:Exopolyphosphatase